MSLPPLTEVFAYDFMLRALAAGAFVALLGALLGVFTILRGLGMISDGLGHVSFAGVALGLLFNVLPLAFALAATVLGAVAIQLMRERGLVKGDVAIGIVFSAGLALGVAIVSHGQGLGVNISSYLFGNILAVSAADVWVVAGLGAALCAFIGLLYKEMLYVTFNEEAARISGLPVGALNLFFSVVTGAAVVLASRVVGVLLVSALIVVPAAAGLQLARSFRRTLLAAVALGMVAVLLGLYASFAFDIAAGAAIALASIALFVLAAAQRAVRRGRAPA
ncbi:MAG TPA: metal ABC transporter permease [Candidatus Thermoplasmatota archaeon]|nr:metal ABC transporter permease [Candidatus Thermoplasmatota archaeon]